MKQTTLLPLVAIFFSLLAGADADAQLEYAGEAAVVYSHHHLNVTDLVDQKRFWINTLGGTDVPFGDYTVAKFTNVLVFMREQEPTGGTKGTTVNHIGFAVPSLRGLLDKVQSAGYRVVTKEEVPANYEVKDGIAYNVVQDAYLAFVMAPDEIKIEFIEDSTQETAAKLHHIHFATGEIGTMQDWYAKTLYAVPGMRGNFQAADLPGVNLTFSASDQALAGTKGRSLDHIGFEVDGLEAFCRELEGRGVTFDIPYTEIKDLGIAIAFLTDPFGTYVELSEGLDRL